MVIEVSFIHVRNGGLFGRGERERAISKWISRRNSARHSFPDALFTPPVRVVRPQSLIRHIISLPTAALSMRKGPSTARFHCALAIRALSPSLSYFVNLTTSWNSTEV